MSDTIAAQLAAKKAVDFVFDNSDKFAELMAECQIEPTKEEVKLAMKFIVGGATAMLSAIANDTIDLTEIRIELKG